MEDILGKPVRHLAYPYGAYNDYVMQIAYEANYEAAYAAGEAPNTTFARERFDAPKLTVNNPFSFPIIARGWGGYLRKMRYRASEIKEHALSANSYRNLII